MTLRISNTSSLGGYEANRVTSGVEITTIADIPSRGTGLGSSSTVTVGLLNALHKFAGRDASPAQLAEEACLIEIDILGRLSA